MTTLREAAQQALEALVDAQLHNYGLKHRETDRLITALRAALAEPDPFNLDWDQTKPLDENFREHLAEIQRLRVELLRVWLEAPEQKPLQEPVQEPTWKRTVLTIQGESVPLGLVAGNPFTFRCPNCASLEAQNTELDRKLAEMERQPVAWVCYGSSSDEKHAIDYQQEDIDAVPVGTMLYTAPQRKPLSQQQLLDLYAQHAMYQEEDPVTSGWWTFARAIERAHGIGGQDE